MGGAFIVIMPGIMPDIFVVGLPRVKMPQQQVMLSARGLTQRNQIVWIKLQLGVQVERLDMVDLQMFTPMTAGHARGFAQEVRPFHSRPFGTPWMS